MAAPEDLGTAPADAEGIASLEIRNDQTVERTEIAYSGVPIGKAQKLTSTSSLILVGPGERLLPAQFNVISRHASSPTDSSAPIRWLQVAVRATVPANSSVRYSLRRVALPMQMPDARAVTVTTAGNLYEVRTGPAVFRLNPSLPGLFDTIVLGERTVYSNQAGAGPFLVYADGSLGGRMLNTAADPDSFVIEESGPVKAVVKVSGHFGGATAACGADPAYTARFTFHRGSADVGLEYDLRNECESAGPNGSGLWAAVFPIKRAGWNMPFSLNAGSLVRFAANENGVTLTVPGSGSSIQIEQAHGSTSNANWRRARVLKDGQEAQSATSYQLAGAGLGDSSFTAIGHMAWMRFKEPMGVAAAGSTLTLLFVSDDVKLGEAQARWHFARVHLGAAAPSQATLSAGLAPSVAALERGLLLSAGPKYLNSTGVVPHRLPELANGDALTTYLAIIQRVHQDTVASGGQWDQIKTFGISWPDSIGNSAWQGPTAQPGVANLGSNYWSPTSSELQEFMRSGDPRWIWDFAYPMEQTFLKSIVYNTGSRAASNYNFRNGFHAGNFGNGDQNRGETFRKGWTSDDYLYNQGSGMAYALRPTGSLRDVFATACQTFLQRYNAAPGLGEIYSNQLLIRRQVMQHLNMLEYAAEFVQDSALNQSCRNKLRSVMQKYAQYNLAGGVFCPNDTGNSNGCTTDQAFMYSALHQDVFYNYLSNHGDADLSGSLKRALGFTAQQFFLHMIPRTPAGGLDMQATWANFLNCAFSGGATSCVGSSVGEPLYGHEKAMHLSTIMIGSRLQNDVATCRNAAHSFVAAMGDGDFVDYFRAGYGWWKGASQSMRQILHGVGAAEVCQ